MPKTRRRFEGWLEETVGDCAALRSTPWGSAALLSSFLFLCLLLAGAASAQMDDIDRALEEETYFALLPQFLVTGVV